ncbi:MAG: adenosylcobinamide-phosphate synthase [Gaiellales bacterium]|nr:adenosylcobinamide-phosphate synthase [Gaiellales bacterium]
MLERALVGVAALAIDAAAGEPPARLHPVVAIGSLLSGARRRWRAHGPAGELAEGAAGLAVAVAASAVGAVAVQRLLARLPRSAALLGEAGALSTLLALRGLREAVQGVRAALDADELDAARALAARDLVSRDTAQLDASELSGAAIQSLAENLSDSVIAPLLAYAAGGLPGAAAYRALNTADAMWGYRTTELLHRGRAAARADDVANLVPARLTALLIALRSPQRAEALRVALRDHGLAPSPNGGWPMAAMAGGLGVCLVKRDSYAFNADAPAPVAADIGRALGVVGG